MVANDSNSLQLPRENWRSLRKKYRATPGLRKQMVMAYVLLVNKKGVGVPGGQWIQV